LEPTAAHTCNVNTKKKSQNPLVTRLLRTSALSFVRKGAHNFTVTRKPKSHDTTALQQWIHPAQLTLRSQLMVTKPTNPPSLPPPLINMLRVSSDVIFQTIKHRLLHTFPTTDPALAGLCRIRVPPSVSWSCRNPWKRQNRHMRASSVLIRPPALA
jgi:hypothetical protein